MEQAVFNTINAFEESNASILQKIDAARRAVALGGEILENNSYLNFPLMLNGKLTEINMYVLNASTDPLNISDNFSAFISMATTAIGVIQVNIKSGKNGISAGFEAETEGAAALLSSNRETLSEAIGSSGFPVRELNFSFGTPKDIFKEIIMSADVSQNGAKTQMHEIKPLWALVTSVIKYIEKTEAIYYEA